MLVIRFKLAANKNVGGCIPSRIAREEGRGGEREAFESCRRAHKRGALTSNESEKRVVGIGVTNHIALHMVPVWVGFDESIVMLMIGGAMPTKRSK